MNNYNCIKCSISSEERTHHRRCFITGEYCSMQMNVHKERERLHDNGRINAFVVMNFSDMSDVVYKWRIKPFVKSIKDYLYFEKKEKKLHCCSDPIHKEELLKNKQYSNVEINVVRSDSEPGSNYVICNRICQQIQIADLIIIDVSTQNPNVFYEFGLAVSLRKLILPICFDESFYKREIPEDEKLYKKRCNETDKFIGNYPWRKVLFEHFGIIYKKNVSDSNEKFTRYVDYNTATRDDLKYDDIKYARFPYHEKIDSEGNKIADIPETKDFAHIGKKIYERLENTYNSATSLDNTLVVYTLEGFQNRTEVGRCIVNYHKKITSHLHENECFCGDRVGILVQRNLIPDSDKDAKESLHLFYNLAEIIHIGMNDALYGAQRDKVKPDDYLKAKYINLYSEDNNRAAYYEARNESIKQSVKDHVGNRGLVVYPENPIYVARLKNGLQCDILDMIYDENNIDSFCFYNVMVKTLSYVNELVVDISKNCIQSLFWLGGAHGLDINTITVMHEETPLEREIVTGSSERKERSIFDVAGLWAAVFRSNDTDGFYKQLMQVQYSIEQRDKLVRIKQNDESFVDEQNTSNDKLKIRKSNGAKSKDFSQLESYYRNRFWKRLLKYNELYLYMCHHNEDTKTQKDKRISVSKWDMDATKILSRYLSQRSVIGEYQFLSIDKEEHDENAKSKCFISIGSHVKPLEEIPLDFLENMYEKNNVCQCGNGSIRGFKIRKNKYLVSWLPNYECATCDKCNEMKGKGYISTRNPNEKEREIVTNHSCTKKHIELAQLRIWWDKEEDKERYFRVEFNGSSGPATLALSSLFVDDSLCEIKVGIKKNRSNLLYSMQEKIRKELIERYRNVLKDKLYECCGLSNISNENRETVEKPEAKVYCELVMYSVSVYLSTVLYRYFLPMLTERDVKRICNGMRSYIISMSAEKVSPFVKDYTANGDRYFASPMPNHMVSSVIKNIPIVLENVLRSFIGIEVIYQVEVDINSLENTCKAIDTRKVVRISELGGADKRYAINCVFKN